WVAGPVLAADLAGGRLRVGLRPLGGLLLGVLAALCLAQATARTALRDQLGWDELLGTAPPSWGASLAAIEDGRALRPALAESALCFRAGLALARQGRPGDARRDRQRLHGRRQGRGGTGVPGGSGPARLGRPRARPPSGPGRGAAAAGRPASGGPRPRAAGGAGGAGRPGLPALPP